LKVNFTYIQIHYFAFQDFVLGGESVILAAELSRPPLFKMLLIEPLLGDDREISSYATAVAKI
jgi:hypothetical protein